MQLSLDELLEKYLAESLNSEEDEAFQKMLKDDDNLHLLESLVDQYANSKSLLGVEDEKLKHLSFERLRNSISQRNEAPVHRIHFLRRGFLRYAAAVLVLAGLGWFLFYNNKSSSSHTGSTFSTVKTEIKLW